MTPQELTKLKNDVTVAHAAAARAVAGKPDTGTCNLDRPYLPKSDQFTDADEKVREALEQGGVRPYWVDYEGCWSPGWHFGGLPGWGGDARSLAAQTFCDVMRERGWMCFIHRQMD